MENEGGEASNTLLNPFQFFTSLVIKGLIIIHDCYLLAITGRHGWILRPFSLPLVTRDTWYPTVVITQNDLKWRGGCFVYKPRVLVISLLLSSFILSFSLFLSCTQLVLFVSFARACLLLEGELTISRY